MPDVMTNWAMWLVPLLAGAVLSQVWTRYRGRLRSVRYQVSHTYLGAASDSPLFGTLRISLNDIEYQNIYISVVALANETGYDFQNLDIDLVAGERTQILGSYGRLASSFNYLPLEENFLEQVREAAEEGDETFELSRGRQDFSIPVFNRDDQATITLLTTHLDGEQPQIFVGADYPGLVLKAAPAVDHFLGEPRDRTAIQGLGIALLLAWPVAIYVPGKVVAVLGGTLLGGFCLILGVGARRIIKWLARIGS